MMSLRATASVACVVGAISVVVAPTATAATPAPSEPGSGYALDWERATDRTVPQAPPPGWAAEYWPDVRHANGEPQVRVADAGRGEPVRATSTSRPARR